jgi:hypothetical protein
METNKLKTRIKTRENVETARQRIYLDIPSTDMLLFNELATKMGWEVETKGSILQEYIISRPKDVDLSEDEILSEIKAVRYKS